MKITYENLPKDYDTLIQLYLPKTIKTEAENNEALRLIEILMGYDEFTDDQEIWIDEIVSFIVDFEEKEYKI